MSRVWVRRNGVRVLAVGPKLPPADEPADPTQPAPEVTPAFKRTLNDVVYDLYGPQLRTDGKYPTYGKHEAPLAGINKSWDWAHGARGNSWPPFPLFKNDVTYEYINAWGQVIPAEGGMSERDVRVEVDRPTIYFLRTDNTWIVAKASNTTNRLEGSYWTSATFSGTGGWTLGNQFREEGSTGHSFTCLPMTTTGGLPTSAPVAHWYYSGFWPRLYVPTNVKALATVTRMRLIPGANNPNANLDGARFVGCFSNDIFDEANTTVGATGNNPAIAITRHKFLTKNWKPFGIVTGTESAIRNYPAMPFLVT